MRLMRQAMRRRWRRWVSGFAHLGSYRRHAVINRVVFSLDGTPRLIRRHQLSVRPSRLHSGQSPRAGNNIPPVTSAPFSIAPMNCTLSLRAARIQTTTMAARMTAGPASPAAGEPRAKMRAHLSGAGGRAQSHRPRVERNARRRAMPPRWPEADGENQTPQHHQARRHEDVSEMSLRPARSSSARSMWALARRRGLSCRHRPPDAERSSHPSPNLWSRWPAWVAAAKGKKA